MGAREIQITTVRAPVTEIYAAALEAHARRAACRERAAAATGGAAEHAASGKCCGSHHAREYGACERPPVPTAGKLTGYDTAFAG